jgi:predicted branched-subunit amino acid permease
VLVSTADLVSGARAVLPAIVAFAPLALMVGAAVAASGNCLAAWLSTWTIHGGAAQLVTLEVVAQEPGWIAAATAGLLVQARLSAYSTAMVTDWRTAPLGHRVLAGLVLSDAPWALARSRSTGRRGFYLGAGLALFLAWPAMVTVGTLAGDVVGGFAAAGLVPALVLGCTVVTQLRGRPVLVAAAAAGLSAVVTVAASAGVAFVSAAAVGVAAGLAADRPHARDLPGATAMGVAP